MYWLFSPLSVTPSVPLMLNVPFLWPFLSSASFSLAASLELVLLPSSCTLSIDFLHLFFHMSIFFPFPFLFFCAFCLVGMVPITYAVMWCFVYVFGFYVVIAISACYLYLWVISMLSCSFLSFLMHPLHWLLTSEFLTLYVLVFPGDEYVWLRSPAGRSWHRTFTSTPPIASMPRRTGNGHSRTVWLVLWYWVHPPI